MIKFLNTYNQKYINNNNKIIINKSNKNIKLDYDTIKNIVQDNPTNIRTSQPHKSNKRLQKLK